jgi:transcriptional regulator with XRE-family HTH domain
MVKANLLPLWHKKEEELGRRLTIKEVAAATGADPKSIASLRNGDTTRFDSSVLGPLCKYFGVPEGVAVPFLIVHYGDGNNGGK